MTAASWRFRSVCEEDIDNAVAKWPAAGHLATAYRQSSQPLVEVPERGGTRATARLEEKESKYFRSH